MRNSRLIALNASLVLAIAYAGFHFRSQWTNARQQERAVLSRKAAAPPRPQLQPLPALHPALPSAYIDVAQKMLFDKSRNSTVVIETPPPPPPKPVPPLPAYHGQMNLGDGPMVILSEGTGPHKSIRPGEQIGPFKLVEATRTELAFEWDGKVIRKNVEELVDRSGNQAAQAAPAPAAAAAAAPAPPPAQKLIGPGQDTVPGSKSCNPNDGYADGAVVDGYRRVNTATPFGIQCRWDAVRQ